MSTDPLTNGAHHIGLTVPDVAETAAFFVDVLGFKQVGSRPDYPAIFVKDAGVVLSLWQTRNRSTQVEFDRKHNVGLHHLALQVDGAAALAVAHERICAHGSAAIAFGPESLGAGPSQHMMCVMPGGIRLELIAPSKPGGKS
jgi:catechol 2,3-dioxygenase-like lactoylglutathione lyase family enzyme